MAKIACIRTLTIECCHMHAKPIIDALAAQKIQPVEVVHQQCGFDSYDLDVLIVKPSGDDIYASTELLTFIDNIELT